MRHLHVPVGTAPHVMPARGWWNGARVAQTAWGSSGRAGSGRVRRADDEAEYLAEMVAHHREAVASARELARSQRAAMRSLGEAIVTTRSAQIRQMERWLRAWSPDGPVPGAPHLVRDLSQLSGDALDRAFLDDMLGHHALAAAMSDELLRRGTAHDRVARIARDVADQHRAELVLMRRWIVRWFGTADHRRSAGADPGGGPAPDRR